MIGNKLHLCEGDASRRGWRRWPFGVIVFSWGSGHCSRYASRSPVSYLGQRLWWQPLTPTWISHLLCFKSFITSPLPPCLQYPRVSLPLFVSHWTSQEAVLLHLLDCVWSQSLLPPPHLVTPGTMGHCDAYHYSILCVSLQLSCQQPEHLLLLHGPWISPFSAITCLWLHHSHKISSRLYDCSSNPWECFFPCTLLPQLLFHFGHQPMSTPGYSCPLRLMLIADSCSSFKAIAISLFP